ncbi:MAG: hypothetical protein WC797_01200 [Candidatus Paceibacterota bacterium]|jgi:hypothetical protein
MSHVKRIIGLFAVMVPGLAFADLNTVVQKILGQLGSLPALILAIAVLYFLWGVVSYVRAGADGDIAEASAMIIWGLVAIFVIIAVWGLVGLISTTFGVGTTGTGLSAPGLTPS